MSGSKSLRRREFLRAAAAAGAAGGAVSCAKRKGNWRYLTIDEANTVTAICERFIPADEDPGAAWAGVTNFIDRQLAGHYRKFQKTYRQGLIGVDHVSEHLFAKHFVELAAAQQDQVLTALDKGEVPSDVWNKAQAKQFFDLVLTHTMQGFYGDPRHGGNREAVGWRMLGLSVVPVRGRDQYDLTKPEVPLRSGRRGQWV